jgi:hypothetical protein
MMKERVIRLKYADRHKIFSVAMGFNPLLCAKNLFECRRYDIGAYMSYLRHSNTGFVLNIGRLKPTATEKISCRWHYKTYSRKTSFDTPFSNIYLNDFLD